MPITVDHIREELDRCRVKEDSNSLKSQRAHEIADLFIERGVARSHCQRWLRKAGIKFSDHDFFVWWQKKLDANVDF
jgi:hypothetical protein